MRLLLITGTFPTLSETFIYRKACALAERGHEVTVACRRIGDLDAFRETPLPKSVRLLAMPPDVGWRQPRRAASAAGFVLSSWLTSPSLSLKVWRACSVPGASRRDRWSSFLRHAPLAAQRPDVLHFEFASQARLYPALPSLIGCPWMLSCRGADIHLLPQAPDSEQVEMRSALQSASAVHAVSEEMANSVRALAGASLRPIVIHPAVPKPREAPPSPERTPPHILSIGRLVWKKGFDYLLAALSILRARSTPFTAEIIGDGPLRQELEFSIHDLGLASQVTLTGALRPAEVQDRLASASLFALSSVEEGLSNAALEAMALGVPVVTTDAGGMREAVIDGVSGRVVPVRDPVALADALETLLSQPALRAAMGDAGRARHREAFDVDRQIFAFERLYTRLCERQAS